MKRLPELKEIKELKGRNSGNYIFLEANIVINTLSFNEAHKITDKIEHNIKKEITDVAMIRIHYEPFNIGTMKSCISRGYRKTMNIKSTLCPRRKEIYNVKSVLPA